MSLPARIIGTAIAATVTLAIVGLVWLTAALGGLWQLVLACCVLFLVLCLGAFWLLSRLDSAAELAEDDSDDVMGDRDRRAS